MEKEVEENGLNKINTIKMPTYPDDMVTDGSLVLLQYVSGDQSINIYFSEYNNMGKSKHKRIKAFASFLRLIKEEFNVNLSLNKKGYDFLNTNPKKSPKYIDEQVPLEPVKSLP